MHISDGILDVETTIAVSCVSAVLFIYSLKKMKNEDITMIASMAALFFIASFVHIPIGPTQIHLLLIGIIGVFIGSMAFVSICIALLLQALLLGYGGLSSLGVNLFLMAMPALLVSLYIKLPFVKKLPDNIKFFSIGFLGIFFAVVFLFSILLLAKEEYKIAAYSIFAANIPAMILEGLICLFLLKYIKKSMPKLLKDKNL